jgi:hypothetical protein
MTHILILSGTADGGIAPRTLDLTRVENENVIHNRTLEYILTSTLTLTKVTNTQTFGSLTLETVIITEFDQTIHHNVNTFGSIDLAAIPFEPENAETVALLDAFDQEYPTTEKIQIDTLISELKASGAWATLDWYGNGYWARSEHDALLNWFNPAQTLVKVGGASWTYQSGLKGVNPMTASGRYKSGWNVGAGPYSTTTSLTLGVKVTTIDVPQNGMQPMGCFEFSTPGPAAPNGSFIFLNVIAATGSGGGNVLPFNGNTGYAIGSGGLGVHATVRSGGNNKTYQDGVQLDSDSVSGVASYTHAEGFCVAGSAPGFLGQKSFPGFQIYWWWGAAMTQAQVVSMEDAFQEALLPPGVVTVTGALIIDDDNNYLGDENDDYIIVDGA